MVYIVKECLDIRNQDLPTRVALDKFERLPGQDNIAPDPRPKCGYGLMKTTRYNPLIIE